MSHLQPRSARRNPSGAAPQPLQEPGQETSEPGLRETLLATQAVGFVSEAEGYSKQETPQAAGSISASLTQLCDAQAERPHRKPEAAAQRQRNASSAQPVRAGTELIEGALDA
mmetsp:Transcript_34565/g.107639  ORF Transcript_34565/g.107639 Transcript_34565/m.107639 type:complete len:113 (-) Transcript_34565:32-370(-)